MASLSSNLLQLALDGQGDGPGLLGDDDDRRVRLLREPDGGQVAGPRLERAPQAVGGRQGQQAGRRDDPVALDDDGAVVEGRVGEEDRDQQVLGQDGVDLGAAVGVGRERDLLLDGDQGPDLLLGQVIDGLEEVVDLLLEGAQGQGLAEGPRADLGQEPPDLGLEEDDDGDDDVVDEGPDDPVRDAELAPAPSGGRGRR